MLSFYEYCLKNKKIIDKYFLYLSYFNNLLFSKISIFNNYKTFLLVSVFLFFSLNFNTKQIVENTNFLNPHEGLKKISFKYSDELISDMVNKIYSEKIIESKRFFEFGISHQSNFLISKKISSNQLYDNMIFEKKYSIIEENELLDLASSKWKIDYSDKKIKFIETLLPIISYENKKILIERDKLLEIKKFIQINKTLKSEDIVYLNNIAKKYLINISNKHKIDLIDELLNSVNTIPNSIVLAQAANESGWGSSRFAKEYNALFGQYTYDEKNGVIPFEREEGKRHLIKNFSSINKSVESYFRNINTHYAYKTFREIRNKINNKHFSKSVKDLTGALDVYAEDKSYVKIINSIIDSNNLTKFDLINLPFINS